MSDRAKLQQEVKDQLTTIFPNSQEPTENGHTVKVHTKDVSQEQIKDVHYLASFYEDKIRTKMKRSGTGITIVVNIL